MFHACVIGAEALERRLPGEESPASDDCRLCSVAFNRSGRATRDRPLRLRLAPGPGTRSYVALSMTALVITIVHPIWDMATIRVKLCDYRVKAGEFFHYLGDVAQESRISRRFAWLRTADGSAAHFSLCCVNRIATC
jgi:hypothetical protein